MTHMRILTTCDLNRATLARQWLLERSTTGVVDAVEHLAGLQAQEARPPFIGLWSRLVGFSRGDLVDRIIDRSVVRASTLRGTLHLHSAQDYVRFRSCLQPMLTCAMASTLKGRLESVDLDDLVGQAHTFFRPAPASFDDLRKHFESTRSGADIRALAYACRLQIPLIYVADDPAAWGYTMAARFMPADMWIGRPISAEDHTDDLVLRYLAAFGPASIADAQAWCGLAGLAAAFKQLREQLIAFRDESGRELFDLLDAPRPAGDVSAPVRFLPDFDNVLLAHANRGRIIGDRYRRRIVTANGRVGPAFLIDGFVAGLWKAARSKKRAILTISPFEAINHVRGALEEEGLRLLTFIDPSADGFDIVFDEPG